MRPRSQATHAIFEKQNQADFRELFLRIGMIKILANIIWKKSETAILKQSFKKFFQQKIKRFRQLKLSLNEPQNQTKLFDFQLQEEQIYLRRGHLCCAVFTQKFRQIGLFPVLSTG